MTSRQQHRRATGTVSREVAGEVVVVDERTALSHVLGAEASAVWRALDRPRTPDEVAGASGVGAHTGEVLAQLLGAGLVEPASGPGRRAVLRGAAIGGGVLAAPVLQTVLLPTAAAAISAGETQSYDVRRAFNVSVPTPPTTWSGNANDPAAVSTVSAADATGVFTFRSTLASTSSTPPTTFDTTSFPLLTAVAGSDPQKLVQLPSGLVRSQVSLRTEQIQALDRTVTMNPRRDAAGNHTGVALGFRAPSSTSGSVTVSAGISYQVRTVTAGRSVRLTLVTAPPGGGATSMVTTVVVPLSTTTGPQVLGVADRAVAPGTLLVLISDIVLEPQTTGVLAAPLSVEFRPVVTRP